MENLKTKTERTTLFLSFLDGSEEELSQLHDQLEKAGILDDYRIIATAKPVQILDEREMTDLINAWNTKTGEAASLNTHNNIRNSIHHIEKSLQLLKNHTNIVDENFKNVEKSFSQLQMSLISALGNVKGASTPPNSSFNRLAVPYSTEITYQLEKLNQYSPKEGTEWI